MAYGVNNINDQTIFAASQTKNPNQLDLVMFTDFVQETTPTATFLSEGSAFGSLTTLGGAINNASSTIISRFGGFTGSSSAISLSTGTTNNATGLAYVGTHSYLMPGLPIPTAGLITKYEFETTIATDTAIHTNAVRGGYFMGFGDPGLYGNYGAGNNMGNGPVFRYICDGTTTDTNWMIYWINPSTGLGSSFDTGVTVSTSTIYRMYLSVEVNSAGTFTTTYKIKNLTTGTNTEGTASPSDVAHYSGSGWSTYGMCAGINNCKSGITATTTSIILNVDYLGLRIRRPITREILIGGN